MKLREQPLTIDCFIPYQTETQFTELARTFLAGSSIRFINTKPGNHGHKRPMHHITCKGQSFQYRRHAADCRTHRS